MKTGIKIYEDHSAAAAFKKDCETTMNRCNHLINVYQSFQDWKKVTTYELWIDLVMDPVALMNETILQNIEIKVTGGKRPDPAILASMFGIEYEAYLNIVAGHPVTDLDCVPCNKVKVRKGSVAITLSEYEKYQDYVVFDSGIFQLNDSKIAEHLKTYDVYIDKPEQIEMYQHWQKLCGILNEHSRRGYLGVTSLETISKLCGLRYVFGTNQIYVNEDFVKGEILKIEI